MLKNHAHGVVYWPKWACLNLSDVNQLQV